jgi:predicted NBD/HSP70 family sugar kinase
MAGLTFTTHGGMQKAMLRRGNQNLVLTAVRREPLLSRADLVRITGLSASTITLIVNRLIANGLLEEVVPDGTNGQIGRQPTPLRLRPGARYVIGVEIGKTHSRVVLADWSQQSFQTRNVAWHDNPKVYLHRMYSVMRSFVRRLPPEAVLGVGASVPGTVDPHTGRVIAAENLGWFGINLPDLLVQDLQLPVFCDNEARLCALAETWYQHQEPPLSHIVFVTSREGLGTGVIAGGRALYGGSGAAGEFGHVVLFPDGRPCSCGNRGCWEQYASSSALERIYYELASGSSSLPSRRTAEEIVKQARQSDPVALSALTEVARYLGRGMVNLIMAFNPEEIIVGDYIAEGWDLIEPVVREVIRDRAPAYFLTGLRIRPSKHGRDAYVKGAIGLVLFNVFTDLGDKERRTLTRAASASA